MKESGNAIGKVDTIFDTRFDTIPTEMRQYVSWVLWKLESDAKGNLTKVPYTVTNGYHHKASPTNPDHWRDFDTVVEHFTGDTNNNYAGIGFCFSGKDPFCFIDFDDVLNTNYNFKNQDDYKMFIRLTSWAEYSQSGRGMHIICRITPETAQKIRHNKVKYPDGRGFELYYGKRFCAMTSVAANYIKTIEQLDDAVLEYHQRYFVDYKEQQRQQKSKSNGTPKSNAIMRVTKPKRYSEFTADELITKIRKAKNAEKFNALMKGAIDGYAGASEARRAFLNMLLFYTDDPEVLEEIIRRSGLDDASEKHNFDDQRGDGTFIQYEIQKAINEYDGEQYSAQYYDTENGATTQMDIPQPISKSIEDLLSTIYRPRRHDGVAVTLQPVLHMDGSPVMNRSDIGLIIGEPGSGKSRIFESIMAELIKPGCGIGISVDPNVKTTLYVDSERSNARLKQAYLRILRRADVEEGDIPSNIKIVGLVDLDTVADKIAVVKHRLNEQPYDLVILDMMTDFVTEENSQIENADLLAFLKSVANRYNGGVLLSIHNVFKNDTGYGRGYAGTVAQQKCSFVAKIEKYKSVKKNDNQENHDDDDDAPQRWCIRTTKVSEGPPRKIIIEWDETTRNYERFTPEKRERGRPTDDAKDLKLARQVFWDGKDLSWTEFRDRIAQHRPEMKPDTIIARLVKKGYCTKREKGAATLYNLKPDKTEE